MRLTLSGVLFSFRRNLFMNNYIQNAFYHFISETIPQCSGYPCRKISMFSNFPDSLKTARYEQVPALGYVHFVQVSLKQIKS